MRPSRGTWQRYRHIGHRCTTRSHTIVNPRLLWQLTWYSPGCRSNFARVLVYSELDHHWLFSLWPQLTTMLLINIWLERSLTLWANSCWINTSDIRSDSSYLSWEIIYYYLDKTTQWWHRFIDDNTWILKFLLSEINLFSNLWYL